MLKFVPALILAVTCAGALAAQGPKSPDSGSLRGGTPEPVTMLLVGGAAGSYLLLRKRKTGNGDGDTGV